MKEYDDPESGLTGGPQFVRPRVLTLAVSMKTRLSILVAMLLLPIGPAMSQSQNPAPHGAEIRSLGKNDRKLAWAFENRISEIQVTCTGMVVYKLTDDISDIRHQRFLIELASGQTLLIAHNIDLAKRVKPLRIGDKVSVRGEYIWNEKGGLIHYTHDDPAGVHPGGWIKRKGIVFH